jgi:hypothetical protein
MLRDDQVGMLQREDDQVGMQQRDNDQVGLQQRDRNLGFLLYPLNSSHKDAARMYV